MTPNFPNLQPSLLAFPEKEGVLSFSSFAFLSSEAAVSDSVWLSDEDDEDASNVLTSARDRPRSTKAARPPILGPHSTPHKPKPSAKGLDYKHPSYGTDVLTESDPLTALMEFETFMRSFVPGVDLTDEQFAKQGGFKELMKLEWDKIKEADMYTVLVRVGRIS